MGYYTGAIALRVKEGNNVPNFDLGSIDGLTNDQITAFDLGVHRIGKNEQREVSAKAGHFLLVHKALDDQGHIDYQNGDQNRTQNRTDDGQKRVFIEAFLFVHLLEPLFYTAGFVLQSDGFAKYCPIVKFLHYSDMIVSQFISYFNRFFIISCVFALFLAFF
jgi:hypothetical protein